MAADTFSLDFDGYWLARNADSMPRESGLYCVYVGRYLPNENTVSIRKLVYVGESTNVHDRIAGHERRPDWKRHIEVGEELCFGFAPIVRDRERVEAALIHFHKPPENDEYVHSFTYDPTWVTTTGKNAKLAASFNVRTKQPAY